MSPPAAPRPWHRNPYLWAMVIGIALITITRPLTRNIPPPPPILATLPPLSLQDSLGNPLSIPNDDPQSLWVLYLFSSRCGPPCDPALSALNTLADRARREGLSLHIISVCTDPSADTPQSLLPFSSAHPALRFALPPPPASLDALLSASQPSSLGLDPPLSWLSPFFTLIDGQGHIRGHYPYDTEGLDELFHRAQRLRARP